MSAVSSVCWYYGTGCGLCTQGVTLALLAQASCRALHPELRVDKVLPHQRVSREAG